MPNTLSHITFLTFADIIGFRYESFFDSIDGMSKDIIDDASITLLGSAVQLVCGSTDGSYARLRKQVGYQSYSPSWISKVSLKSKVYFEFNSGGSDDSFLSRGIGGYNEKGVGFRFKSDGIYGYCSDGINHEEVKVVSKAVGNWNATHLLEFQFYPANQVLFLVDGVISGSLSAYLPSGTEDSGHIWSARVGGNGLGVHLMEFSSIFVYQDL